MIRGRLIAWLVAAVSLVTLIGSTWLMGLRIRDYNAAIDRPTYRFIETDEMSFEFAGRPVRITDDLDEDGRGAVTVRFADDELVLPVAIPTSLPFEGLNRHKDWLRMLIFADAGTLGFQAFRAGVQSGEIPTRLVIVTRTPNPGVDQSRFNLHVDENAVQTWGAVMRARWTFDLYEFEPEGGFRAELDRKYPESGKSFERRRNTADLKGEPEPTRDPDELVEFSWQWEAALRTMPRPPSITFEQQALRSAGWTLPVASVSVLALMASIALACAPKRTR